MTIWCGAPTLLCRQAPIHRLKPRLSRGITHGTPNGTTNTKRIISTLDRRKLSSGDYYDISGIRIPSYNGWHSMLRYQESEPIPPRGAMKALPFPEGTHGFLYHRPTPGLPTMYSSVRFRVTPTDDPATFDQGYDLPHPVSKYWCLPMIEILQSNAFDPFKSILLAEGVIEPELNEKWEKRPGNPSQKITVTIPSAKPVAEIIPDAITTLDPARLTSEHYKDISNILRPRLPATKGNIVINYHSVVAPPKPDSRRPIGLFEDVPFPEGTKGFLYYRAPPPDVPKILGEIRFCLTSSSDPASFESGKDLTRWSVRMDEEVPWRVTLFDIVTAQSCAALRNLLYNDGVIEEGFATRWRDIYAKRHAAGTIIIHKLGQPFKVKFSGYKLSVGVLGDFEYGHAILSLLWADRREVARDFMLPYTGTAMCCLERSTLPEHAGRRIIVLRVLSIVEPVKSIVPDYDGHVPMPTEGLFYRGGKKLWACDLDKPEKLTKDLVMLWPKEEEAPTD